MYRDKSKRSNNSEAVEDSSDPGAGASKCDDYSSFLSFPPFPETQPFDFGGPFLSAHTQPSNFDDSVKQEETVTGLQEFNNTQQVPNTGKFEPHTWSPPIIPSTVYCLNNRIENGSTALSSLLFHLDLALEEYPHSQPSDKKHYELRSQLEQNVLKIRHLHKQYLKCKKEIKRIYGLASY